jgi:hypothetical protein
MFPATSGMAYASAPIPAANIHRIRSRQMRAGGFIPPLAIAGKIIFTAGDAGER